MQNFLPSLCLDKSVGDLKRHVLLTGATGYVGIHIATRFIDVGQRVICLVRAKDTAEAKARVLRAALRWSVPSDGLDELLFETGDVTEPDLGLSKLAYQDMQENVGLVVNCAAMVNFVYPYRILAQTNVAGVKNVAKFALRADAALIHLSSQAVFLTGNPEPGQILSADAPPFSRKDLPGAYSRSKSAAETILTAAGKAGLSEAAIRPGLVSGHCQTGASATTGYHWLLTKACLQIGCAPDVEERFEVTEVDYLADVIYRLSCEQIRGQRITLPPTHRLAWGEYIDYFRQLGHEIAMKPIDEWQELLLQNPRVGDESNALLPFFRSMRRSPLESLFNVSTGSTPEFDYAKLPQDLVRADTIDSEQDHLQRSVEYLTKQGWLPSPSGAL